MKTSTVETGIAQLAVSQTGAGQALVFLHAGVADKRSWTPLIDALSETMGNFHGFAYDRRGFGDSSFTEERYSRVSDLVAVLDACELPSAVLIGNSQGGRIAIDAALLHAERVRALVLIGTSVSGAPEVAAYPRNVAQIHQKMEAAEAADDLGVLNRLEAHLWLDGPLSVEGRVAGTARELFLDMNRRALNAASAGEATDSVDAWNNLSKIQIPVLLIVGALDLPHLQERSAQMAEIMPDAEFVSMSDVAHLPALEAPQQCAEIISKFLARHNIV